MWEDIGDTLGCSLEDDDIEDCDSSFCRLRVEASVAAVSCFPSFLDVGFSILLGY